MSNFYLKNINKFKEISPLQTHLIQNTESRGFSFCKTLKNELNLVDERGKYPFYFYSQTGALSEAHTWANILPLEKNKVIFVYGIGLGYYFIPLKEWLKADRSRALVFMEEEPAVLNAFLQTELATEILKHPQVEIALLPGLLKRHQLHFDDFWAHMRVEAAPFIWSFAKYPAHMSALKGYFNKYFPFFDTLVLQWYLFLSQARLRLAEFLEASSLVFKNFYANLPTLAEASLAEHLQGVLNGWPLLLCGAGPSLAKQQPVIKTNNENAFIAAAGSGMNALTRASIFPHFGGGVDPTLTQSSRLLTSFAFEVPLFYQNRFCAEALAEWHGPKVYVADSSGFQVGHWFEQELGIQPQARLVGGISTSNFLLELAGVLGCDPIVLAGMDLAYTHNVRYSAGVEVHPAATNTERQALNSKADDLFAVAGLDGKPVYTKQEWLFEAACMGEFKQRYSEIDLLNGTEGGMSIENVSNVTLKQVLQSFSMSTWDLAGWLYGHLENCSIKNKLTNQQIKQAMERWEASLKRCFHFLDSLLEELLINKRRAQIGDHFLLGPYSGKAALWEAELLGEEAYAYLLQTLETVFSTLHKREIRQMDHHLKGKKKLTKQIEIEIDRCKFMQRYVKEHLNFIQGVLNQNKMSLKHSNAKPLSENISEYRSEGKLRICEKDLTIDLTVAFCDREIPQTLWPKGAKAKQIKALALEKEGQREGQTLYFYESGALKVEAYYFHGQLQGPWSFYSEQGKLLVRSWFVQGKKEGKSYWFYCDGSLYSVQGHCSGIAEGSHRYYYPNGSIKTALFFKKGALDESALLYHPNGQIKKSMHFLNGQLHGEEKSWNDQGMLLMEAQYAHNQPVGVARCWHSNGHLAREATYSKEHQLIECKEWPSDG